MRILITVPGIERAFGGPSYTVPRLKKALKSIGEEAMLSTIMNPGDDSPDVDFKLSGRVLVKRKVSWTWRGAKMLSDYLDSARIQVVHDNGIWMPLNHQVVRYGVGRGLPIVLSPRGMLRQGALENSRTKKFLAWHLYQRRDLKSVSVFHATSQAELEDIRRLGFTQPVAVVPNGVDLPVIKEGNRERRVLYLSRIHRTKGLIHLVEAWHHVRPPGWRCTIAGPDDGGEKRRIEREIKKRGLESEIELKGLVVGADKEALLRKCALFAFPTYTENFGVAVAEALSYGIPVITTKGAPWASLKKRDCGWWVETGTDPFADALQEATRLPDERLGEMGRRGRQLVEERFSWGKIAKRMRAVYSWALGDKDTQEDIHF